MAGDPFSNFFGAIMGQESGGNSQAVSSAGALGLYQIMPGNVGPWGRQYLGQNITPSQFLADPGLQTKLAQAVLGDYYNKYGARGAAAAWYSGNPGNAGNYNKVSSGPSVGEYADSILRRMGDGSQYMPAPEATNTSAATADAGVTQGSSIANVETQGLGIGSAAGEGALGLGLSKADGSNAAGLTVGTPATGAMSKSGSTATGGQAQAQSQGGPTPQATGLRGGALEMASKYLGQPYQWGALDCSGLVQRALGQVGVNMPRVSYDQLKMGQRIGVDQAQPGDLIGWGDGHHVALYLGNNQIIEAPRTGLNVRTRSLGDSWDQSQGYYAVSLANLYK